MKHLLFSFFLFVNTLMSYDQTSSEWQQCLGGSSSENVNIVQETNDGGFIIGAETRSDDGDVVGHNGEQDIWIIKLDELANMEWQQCLGGSGFEYIQFIHQTEDGGFLVSGYANPRGDTIQGYNGKDDIFIVKLDKSGNTLWQKFLGGSKNETLISIHLFNNYIFIIGYTYSDDGDVIGFHDKRDIYRTEIGACVDPGPPPGPFDGLLFDEDCDGVQKEYVFAYVAAGNAEKFLGMGL